MKLQLLSKYIFSLITSATILLLLFSSSNSNGQTIIASNDTTICAGSPLTLNAELVGGSYGTNSYSFEVYPYSPEPFSGGTAIDPSFNSGYCQNSQHDDCLAGPFDIGFSFCFFNQYYSKFWVGSNGWISFTNPYTYGSLSNWVGWVPSSLPNPSAPVNCIFSP